MEGFGDFLAERGLELMLKELNATKPMVATGAVSEVEVLRLDREVARLRGDREQADAQISRVQGIEKLNSSVSALTEAYAASQAFAAAGMIGHVSLIEGSHMLLTYADGTEVDADGNKIKVPIAQGGISLPDGADEVTIKVYNSDGELMDSVTMGAQQPGISHFSWDGKGSDGEPLPEGMYSFSVEAKKGGNTVTAKPLGFARIDALTWENGSPKLILSTGQKISPSDIRELL